MGVERARQILIPLPVLLLASTLLWAQEPVSAPAQNAGSLDGYPWEGRIKLDVTVTDKSGKAVPGFASSDFTLLDNGQPAKIVSFSGFDGDARRPDPAVELILVIDAEKHTRDQLAAAQLGIREFLRRNSGHLALPVSVYRVSDGGLAGTDAPSTDGNALAAQIARKDGLRPVTQEEGDLRTQNTSFLNEVANPQSTLGALGSIVLLERRKPGRKLLVWVGYNEVVGEDSFDWETEFSTRLREARIALCGVTFWHPSAPPAAGNNLSFEALAEESGGGVMTEPDNDLMRLTERCVEDASVFYTIAIDAPPTQKVDERHTLSVAVNRPGLRVRTDAGYYDQPVYYDQPPVPAERLTVDELETLLKSAQGESDENLALKLAGTELTERMSSTRLFAWKGRVRGAKTWAALVALGDASAFLAPPLAETPGDAIPNAAAQQAILSKAGEYLESTVSKLPDFFAARTTTRFEQPPGKEGQTWKRATGEQWLRPAGRWEAAVHYRNGFEEVENRKNGKGLDQARLKTSGTFGPILSAVMVDATRGDVDWGRWERGPVGPVSVFRYRVREEDSRYQVSYRGILADGVTTGLFQRMTGYHGEIAIDPASGAVLRLTMEADLDAHLPIDRSSLLVEYGPVEIGGSTHICLQRSITILRMRKIFNQQEWGEGFRIYGPFENLLDDVLFENYHMFRGQARILSGFEDVPERK